MCFEDIDHPHSKHSIAFMIVPVPFLCPHKITSEAIVTFPPYLYVPSEAHEDNPIASCPPSRAYSVVEALVGVLDSIEHAIAGEAVEAGVQTPICARKTIAFRGLRWPPSTSVHVSRRWEDYEGAVRIVVT